MDGQLNWTNITIDALFYSLFICPNKLSVHLCLLKCVLSSFWYHLASEDPLETSGPPLGKKKTKNTVQLKILPECKRHLILYQKGKKQESIEILRCLQNVKIFFYTIFAAIHKICYKILNRWYSDESIIDHSVRNHWIDEIFFRSHQV